MELKATDTFKNYRFADVSTEDLKKISELENSICKGSQEDVILIAYQNCQSDSQKEFYSKQCVAF